MVLRSLAPYRLDLAMSRIRATSCPRGVGDGERLVSVVDTFCFYEVEDGTYCSLGTVSGVAGWIVKIPQVLQNPPSSVLVEYVDLGYLIILPQRSLPSSTHI